MPEPELEYKAFAETKALDTDAGGFEGYASLFGVRDAIGDVVRPGAFAKGLKRFVTEGFIALNHDWQKLPIGTIAEAREDDKGLWIRGEYHSTAEAQAARKVAYERFERGKPMGQSIAFTIAEGGAKATRYGRDLTEVELHEVSHVNMPMLRPARITGVKGARHMPEVNAELKSAIGSHSTATVDEPWDGPGNVRRLSADATEAVYRRMYAWQDPDGDPDTQVAYRFPHHTVGSSGGPSTANVRACIAGIAILNGGRGGTNIPDGDRRGVYAHLARHMRDGDMEPPELRGMLGPGAAAMLAQAIEFAEALEELKAAGNLAHARAMLALVQPALVELDTWLKSGDRHEHDRQPIGLDRLRFESERRLARAALFPAGGGE